MFHPFRALPKRKTQKLSKRETNSQKQQQPTPVVNNSTENNSLPPSQYPLLDECDSSIDMSLYTTESKSTYQYTGNNACCFEPKIWQHPNVNVEKKLDSSHFKEFLSQANTPSTKSSNPEEEHLIEILNVISSTEEERQKSRQNILQGQSQSIEKPVEFKRSSGPVDTDDYDGYDDTIFDDVESSQVFDDVESSKIFDDLSSHSDSWVKSTKGMASNCNNQQQILDNSREDKEQPFDQRNREEKGSTLFLWHDDEDESKEEGEGEGVLFSRKLSLEDAAILSQSYHQTMKSISRTCFPDDLSLDDATGSLLLTKDELQKHLQKVQNIQPPPSSDITGYDKWKAHKEHQHRYFQRLQRKAEEEQKRRQRKEASIWKPKIIETDVSESIMERSVDSTIPSKADGSFVLRHKTNRRRWNNLFSKRHQSPTKQKPSAKHPSKRQETEVISLNQFMQVSNKDKKVRSPLSAEDPSGCEDFSLAPLSKMKDLKLVSSVLEDNKRKTRKGQKLDASHGATSQLAMEYLEKEREKQRQAEYDKDEEERVEQERIRRLKQQELQRQRALNKSSPPKTPSMPRSISSGPIPFKPVQNIAKDSPAPSLALSCEQSVSLTSKLSSGSTGRSTITLSPCIICDAAERTHVAMPCMHFYFCGGCVTEMNKLDKTVCPICSAEDVVFSQVFTG